MFLNNKDQTLNEKLCNIRKAFEQFNLISAVHTFLSKNDDSYNNLLPPLSLLNENDRKKWGLAAGIRGRVWAVLDPFCVATSRWVWRRTSVYWGRSYKIPYGAGSGNKYKWNQSGPGQSGTLSRSIPYKKQKTANGNKAITQADDNLFADDWWYNVHKRCHNGVRNPVGNRQ